MSHNCTTYWGNQLEALSAKLDQGYNDAQGGPGWATKLSRRAEYETLVLLRTRLLGARNPPPPPLANPMAWQGGTIVVNGLMDATTAMLGGLEGDRYSTSKDHHNPNAPRWHSTGVPEPGSDLLLDQLWGRVRNALGC